MLANNRPLPCGPVLDWSTFRVAGEGAIASVESLPHRAFTTSGRGAIYHALLQLKCPAEATVLLPSYHCPTMIAPVVLAGLNVAFYGVRADGLPDLETISADTASRSKAILVPHYFGMARSLAEVRAWCDQRGIALIEDCAHSYFGMAGGRPVGAWGDYSTASLSKFFPVPEAGLLASAAHAIPPLALSRPGLRSQVKGLVDVVEQAVMHKRLFGLNTALSWLIKAKNIGRSRRTAMAAEPSETPTPTRDTLMLGCDMSRIDQSPLLASMVLKSVLPRGTIVARRRENFALYAQCLAGLDGARPLFNTTDPSAAPYVFPLWVDDADRVYQALKAKELPVFRWDRVWPGVPALQGDVGPLWSRHVLQLLCHQNLDEADIRRTASTIASLMREGSVAAGHPPTQPV